MFKMLLFKHPSDLPLLLTSGELERVRRMERRLVRKSYRLRQEEALGVLFPPHCHHFPVHQSAAARRRFFFFPHPWNTESIFPRRRYQAVIRFFVLEMEFTFHTQVPDGGDKSSGVYSPEPSHLISWSLPHTAHLSDLMHVAPGADTPPTPSRTQTRIHTRGLDNFCIG